MRREPVDVPYIVRVRLRSRAALRMGAKAWYAYPALAREATDRAKALRDFVALLLSPEQADAVPLALYRRVIREARRA